MAVGGNHFQGATSVDFNGTVASFNVHSANLITATVPTGATTGKIRVVTPDGSATSRDDFTVSSSYAPSITSFSPTSGPVGSSVTINGSNFVGTTSVKFNVTSATTFSWNPSGTQLTATVPSGATTGKIAVTTPAGTSTSTQDFTGHRAGAPNHHQLLADQWAGGDSGHDQRDWLHRRDLREVRHDLRHLHRELGHADHGHGAFGGHHPRRDRDKLGDLHCDRRPDHHVLIPDLRGGGDVGHDHRDELHWDHLGQVQQRVRDVYRELLDQDHGHGAGRATTGPISVTTPGGTATSSTNFTVIAGPTITSFSPTSGGVGSVVTITGTNFTRATAVRFKNLSATFTINSSTQITATAPAGASTGPISVTTPNGTATSSGNFTVTHPRTASLRLSGHLVAQGLVVVTDGFAACRKNVPVKIQRLVSGVWQTLAKIATADDGSYQARLHRPRG